MPLEFRKVSPVDLRSVGLDEKWLQERIKQDPTILGLGDLEVLSRERRQPSGGRLDFLMYSAEGNIYYEVEVMLGALDESHIIRTIEYWDIERQRHPKAEHRPVIVAELITSRFFNVIRLLNRSVPIIAVQLAAFKINDETITLHAVPILDVSEDAPEDYVSTEVEATDRKYWESKRDPQSLGIMDKILAGVRAAGIEERLSFNKHHIALGTTGNNFCWFHPRKTPGYCHLEFRTSPDTRDDLLESLQASGVDASARGTERISFSLNARILDDKLPVIVHALVAVEPFSR